MKTARLSKYWKRKKKRKTWTLTFTMSTPCSLPPSLSSTQLSSGPCLWSWVFIPWLTRLKMIAVCFWACWIGKTIKKSLLNFLNSWFYKRKSAWSEFQKCLLSAIKSTNKQASKEAKLGKNLLKAYRQTSMAWKYSTLTTSAVSSTLLCLPWSPVKSV